MAMFYPVILFLLAVAIVGGLLVYVVPDIVHVFENTGQKLPWLTAALIGLSGVRSRLCVVDPDRAGGVVCSSVRWLAQQPDVRLEWDRRKFEVPAGSTHHARE